MWIKTETNQALDQEGDNNNNKDNVSLTEGGEKGGDMIPIR